MLGEWISDPGGVEGQAGIRGMELLSVTTVMREKKTRQVVHAAFSELDGELACLNGLPIEGYEIHMGETRNSAGERIQKNMVQSGNICGTYIHGVFDGEGVAPAILNGLAAKKGVAVGTIGTGQMLDYRTYKETQYDLLAETLREHLDMKAVYGMLREANVWGV